jgi:hypothetical protein
MAVMVNINSKLIRGQLTITVTALLRSLLLL